jgi:predicted TIM-barrel fold metal-dependent hydrolase
LRNETEETLAWLASRAVRYDIPIAVLANRGSFPVLPGFLEQNPDVRVLLDHAALPAQGPDPFAEFDGVLRLAKYKNLIVKSSAMSRWSKQPYPFADIHHQIRRLYEAFGAQRLAWGSDYSWEVGRVPYSECVNLFREACDFMSRDDREWILDRTLAQFIGWPR